MNKKKRKKGFFTHKPIQASSLIGTGPPDVLVLRIYFSFHACSSFSCVSFSLLLAGSTSRSVPLFGMRYRLYIRGRMSREGRVSVSVCL